MAVEKLEKEIERDLLLTLQAMRSYLGEQLKDLHEEKGLSVRDQFNIARVDSLVRTMDAQLMNSGYNRAILDMLEGLQVLSNQIKEKYTKEQATAEHYSSENEAAITMLMQDAQSDMLKISKMESEALSGFIRKAVLGGGKISDMLYQVEHQLEVSYNQALTVAVTAMYSFNQMVTIDVCEPLGVEWYAYIGPLDKSTREWCRHWDGCRGKIEDFEATADQWGRESQPNPVRYWRGGYNCRHELVPLITDKQIESYPIGPRG